MVFWIASALLAAAVTYAVTRPLLGAKGDVVTGAAEADLAVYKDQLKEIEADKARGVLSDDEAEAARAEVVRRLIRRSDAEAAAKPAVQTATRSTRAMYTAASIALPVASLAVYLSVGQPGLPAMPLAERLAARPDQLSRPDDLIAKVEARLRARPDDGEGWDVISHVYLSRGDYAKAAEAYDNAIRLLGETPKRLNGFAEARIRADDGIIGETAKQALRKVVAAEPARREARIWLAIAKEQDGDVQGAIQDFRQLIAEAPAETPWRAALQERVAALESSGKPGTDSNAGERSAPKAAEGTPGGIPATTKAERGPSAADIAAAKDMTISDREAMINTMVEGLAAKLKTNGKDAGGWAKLIRAYAVLGRKDDASKALADARGQLSGDDEGLKAVNAVAAELGIGG